jgi:2-methylcitrate dehydratase PrpD
MAKRPVTRELSEWVSSLRMATIPLEVMERTRLITADVTAIALRARHDSESTPALIAAIEAMDLATGRYCVIGDPHAYSATGATLINATCAHSLEMDDTYTERGVHTSCTVVPAALAAAQMVGADGARLLTGIVAGLEATCRVSLGREPEALRAFHSTPTSGYFGATAAAANILGLGAAQVEHAFGIALSQTAGNMQFHVNGAWTKRFQIGAASAAGVLSAALAREGYTGSAAALEGDAGFYALYGGGKATLDRVVDALDQEWQLLNIAFKPHSACRGTHAAIDAAIEIRSQNGFRFEDIESVSIGLPREPIDLIDLLAAPNKLDPQTHVDGQFSINFTVSTALRLGRVGVDDYETQFRDPAIRNLMARTSVFEDPDARMASPGGAAGSVRVHMKDGTQFHHLVTVPKGEPANMLSREEVRAKFDYLATPVIGPPTAERLYETIMNLESARSVEPYFLATLPRE